MNLFSQEINTQDSNLIDSLLDDNIEQFLYELVHGNQDKMDGSDVNTQELDQIANTNTIKEKQNNISREYIKLPDARITKYKHKSRISENERDNDTNNKSRKSRK